jgi:hypothetical protein
MRIPRGAVLAALAVVAALGVWAWLARGSDDERAIRRRLAEFVEDFNASTTDGLGLVARAAKIGSYFTDDVVVDLGAGAGPITGRETLMGMATRLQPRTAAFELELDDITIDVAPDDVAEVTLTTLFRRRSVTSGETSLDAREFSLGMRKVGGDWRVARITAVDILR